MTPEEAATILTSIPQTTYWGIGSEAVQEVASNELVRDLCDAYAVQRMKAEEGRKALSDFDVAAASLKRANNKFDAQALEAIRLRDKLDMVWKAAVKATVEHEGCNAGKKDFLESLLVPEWMWPSKTVVVKVPLEIEVEVSYLGDDEDEDLKDLVIEQAQEMWIDNDPDWSDAEIISIV